MYAGSLFYSLLAINEKDPYNPSVHHSRTVQVLIFAPFLTKVKQKTLPNSKYPNMANENNNTVDD